MYLPKSDNDIFDRSLQVLDKNKTGNIELEEMLCHIEDTYQIIAEVGKDLEELLRNDFEDMDFDNTNSLVLDGLLPYFHRIGRREGIKKCQHWQVEYILSLIDDDGNGALDVDELLANYRVIIKELVNFNCWEDPERRPLFWKNTRKNRLRKSVFARMEAHLKYKPGRRGGDIMLEPLSKIEDTNPLIRNHPHFKLPVTSLVNLMDQDRIFELKKLENAKECEQKQELKISQFHKGVRSMIIQGIENLPGPNSQDPISPLKRSPKKFAPLVKVPTINLELLQEDLKSPTKAGSSKRVSPTKVTRNGNSQFEGFKRSKIKGALARSLLKDNCNFEDIREVSSDSSIETHEAPEVFHFGQKFGRGPTPDLPLGTNKVVSVV
jgi:Ca2+-binding EF-hand superfamily protein